MREDLVENDKEKSGGKRQEKRRRGKGNCHLLSDTVGSQ